MIKMLSVSSGRGPIRYTYHVLPNRNRSAISLDSRIFIHLKRCYELLVYMCVGLNPSGKPIIHWTLGLIIVFIDFYTNTCIKHLKIGSHWPSKSKPIPKEVYIRTNSLLRLSVTSSTLSYSTTRYCCPKRYFFVTYIRDFRRIYN